MHFSGLGIFFGTLWLCAHLVTVGQEDRCNGLRRIIRALKLVN
jgi:hypothetical protein